MKNSLIVIALCQISLVFNASSQSAEPQQTEPTLELHSNMMEAYQVSQSTSNPMLAFFTGSDLGGSCKKLQKEVFAKSAIITWANEKDILE
jgi:hypothetical protein